MKTLYYRISPPNEGIVLAEPARAEYVSELHNALSVAQTWGEFRKLMPFDEYLRYISETFGEPGNLQAVPADHEEFDSSWVWGYLDGDYPPWLQTEIGEVLPPDLLGQYALSESSMLNGKLSEDCCSTKRASVLDAEGAPKGSKQPRGCFDQSLRARQ